ncbi:MAG: FapA family protein [Leptospiraceae bacterium]|nr:FapA family protein [Leptospiraceae bacterium]
MTNIPESILKEIENNEDGSFQIKSQGGFAHLTVFPSGKNGKPVRVDEVVGRLKLLGIERYERKLVEKTVKEAKAEPVALVAWTGGDAVDSRVEIDVTPDKMNVYINVHPPKFGGRILSKGDIIQILIDNKITYGLQENAIAELVEHTKYYVKTLVAKGKEPINSTNGYIKLLFDPSSTPKLAENQFGKVNYKDLRIIQSVETGSVIAEKVAPQLGQDGMDVYSNLIPFAKGTEGNWKVGANCELDENQQKLVAMIAGRPVQEKDGTIRVDEVIHLENVDYSTGNVEFPGMIIVDGNVADDFTLKTKGSLFIKKSVGRVFLYAEKDIVLSGGIMGRSGGFVEAQGNIYAKFVEQGKLKAGGNIIITEASLHSDISAKEGITVLGGRGELIGGEAVAGTHITVSKLGAVVETRTNLTVGLPPEVLDELDRMKEELKNREETLKKVRFSLNRILDHHKKEVSKEEELTIHKLRELEKKYLELCETLKTQFESVSTSFDLSESAYVSIEKNLYPRVNINFGKDKIFNSELKTYTGKYFLYVNPEGFISPTSIPPKNLKPTKDHGK